MEQVALAKKLLERSGTDPAIRALCDAILAAAQIPSVNPALLGKAKACLPHGLRLPYSRQQITAYWLGISCCLAPWIDSAAALACAREEMEKDSWLVA